MKYVEGANKRENFYMGETLVTQELWKAVIGNNPSHFKGEKLPVESVSWFDCQKFIDKLINLTGNIFTLPTQIQWEYAARGGNKSKGFLYCGSNNIDEVAWYGNNSRNQIHEVATKKSNELGLYDMLGNVSEWCEVSNSDKYSCILGGNYSQSCIFPSDKSYLGTLERIKTVGIRLVLNQIPKDLVFNINGVQFSMKYVEGGTFMMGASDTHPSAWSREKPLHKISLDSYYMSETQVTQELWLAVMGDNPSYFKGDNLPVESVSWYDCQEFIHKLNSLTDKSFALPTEAQWEYAARGGNKSKSISAELFSGSYYINEVAWHGDNCNFQPHMVATKKANELGLYDMSGNVEEWCYDRLDDEYYSKSSKKNPLGPREGNYRVLRGGGCSRELDFCRVSFRAFDDPSNFRNYVGLRLVLNLIPKDVVFNVNGVQFMMKYVEGGVFIMGASEEDEKVLGCEKPLHKVQLDSYHIGETQVTQELWQAVMGDNPSHFQGEKQPVENVSWFDCQEFLKKLNSITGKTFTLPTEAQWEYAARGGNKGKGCIYSGSDNINEVAYYVDNGTLLETSEVARKKANELGIYDMSGNVWEWCNDLFDEKYYSNSEIDNPRGPGFGECRVIRGGSWDFPAICCKVSFRCGIAPDDRSNRAGLRIVLLD